MKQEQHVLPTITTLFNQFMMYLFEICNRVNFSIYHGKLEEIFLLKYAIFSLTFLNKLNSNLDRKFYQHLINEIEYQSSIHLEKDLLINNLFSNENIYRKKLEDLFVSCLVDNTNLAHETIQFNLLKSNLNVDLKKVRKIL